MEGILWENSFGVFLFLTVFVAGGIAWMTGRGIATTWRPIWQVVTYTLLLAAVTRFMHFALYEGTLLSFQFLVVDYIVLCGIGLAGYFATRANQMAAQYDWMFEKSGPFSVREKSGSTD